jgi:hypothetical protein
MEKQRVNIVKNANKMESKKKPTEYARNTQKNRVPLNRN